MDLDELLRTAAPPLTPRTAALGEELHRLVVATEPNSVRTRRRAQTVFLAGGVAVGVLGLGAAASATGLLPGWTMFPTPSGQVCEVGVEAHPNPAGDGQPTGKTLTATEQKEALEAARAYLASFDYDSINRRAAIAEWRAAEADIRSRQKASERQPRLEGDDLQVTAVSKEVVERLRSHLATQGHDINAISITINAAGCSL